MPLKFIKDIQVSLIKESILKDISGWIFTNFHHRDNLTDFLLQLDSNIVSTRRWLYIVRKQDEPVKILHKIETNALDSLPGKSLFYSSQEELLEILRSLGENKTFAILKDKNIPVISTVDSGFVELLHDVNINTVSAANLIQLTKGILSEHQIKTQEKAATVLYNIIFNAWKIVKHHFNNDLPLYEKDILDFILEEFEKNNLITDHPPIVAFGNHSGNPHYEVSDSNNALCKKGDVIQLDIWAKLKNDNNSIYADISWVGIYDKKVPEKVEKCFECLCKARDLVIPYVNENIHNPALLTGSLLDQKVRNLLIKNGYSTEIKHRTGHSIDTECHGTGANLDSIEYPDNRSIFSGCSFSVEPGLYFEDFGLRTEIDVTIVDNKAIIPGKNSLHKEGISIPQCKILTC